MEQAKRLLKLASAVSEATEVLAVSQSAFGLRASPGGGISFEDNRSIEENLRIVRNGRLGVGSSSGLPDLPGIVDMAIGSSRFGPKTEWSFPGPSLPAGLEMRHPGVSSIALEDLTGLFLGIEDAVKSCSPNAVVTGQIQRRDLEVFLVNSAGFEGSYSKLLLEFDMEFSFPHREGMMVQALRFCSGLPPASPEQLCREICLHSEWGGRKASLPPEKLPVLLSPAVLCTILQSLRACVSGRNLAAKAGPLPGRIGERIASRAVSIMDRPRLPFGAASAPFDAEGTPTADKSLIRDGCFCGFVTDLATSFELERPSSGNAGRNSGEQPSPVCTNLVFMPGEKSMESLLQSCPSCVHVAELLPGSSGDALSGAFAFAVPAGFLVESGEVAGRITGLTMSGNAFELLAGIVEVEDSVHGVETDWLPAVIAEGAGLRQSS